MGKHVDLDGISASLEELVKAADATDVVKAYGGVNIDSYAHVDERGKVATSYPDTGDVGTIDDMMIGKMQQALVDAGFGAAAISAFMHGKQEDEDSEEDEEEDEMEGKASFIPPKRPSAKFNPGPVPEGSPPKERPIPNPPMGKSDTFVKSMDEYRSDPDVADAVDISPFLEALTARTADQLDAIRKSMHESFGEQSEVNRAMAAAVYQIGQLQKSTAEIVSALNKRLGLVEQQPVSGPKGVTSMSKALVKAMPGEAGVGGDQLTKSEIISTLSYMNLEKGIKELNGRPTVNVVCDAEGGNLIDSGAVAAVHQFLSTHPTESKLARTYR